MKTYFKKGFTRLVDFDDVALPRTKGASSKFTTGFTLLELLVVVAIIGLLTSVVLALLGNAKNKGDDTAVQSNLHTVANQAELFYTNGNSYLPAGGITFSGVCPVAYDASGTNMFSRDKAMYDALAEATKRGNGNSCYSSADSWAVAVGLKSNANTSWCVDVGGAARQVNFAPDSAIDPVTFICKKNVVND